MTVERAVRSLRDNNLGTEGWCAVFGALRDNKKNKIESWDLLDEGINPEIAKVLAEYVSASTAIISLKCSCSGLELHSFLSRLWARNVPQRSVGH